MSALTERKLTPEEYLAIEREAEERSEFHRGEMFAMAGNNRRHSLIVGNFGALLRAGFRGRGCEAHMTEMRVRVAANGLYTYPDILALCGEPEFLDEHEDTVLNPQLIVEVLSASTESYDRGNKFMLYRGLESLREYVLVRQDAPHVEQFQKDDAGRWLLTETVGLDRELQLASVGCDVRLAEIYERVEFSGGSPTPE